jgi:hypothetical protein
MQRNPTTIMASGFVILTSCRHHAFYSLSTLLH